MESAPLPVGQQLYYQPTAFSPRQEGRPPSPGGGGPEGPDGGLPPGTASTSYANTDIGGATAILGNGHFNAFNLNCVQAPMGRVSCVDLVHLLICAWWGGECVCKKLDS